MLAFLRVSFSLQRNQNSNKKNGQQIHIFFEFQICVWAINGKGLYVSKRIFIDGSLQIKIPKNTYTEFKEKWLW